MRRFYLLALVLLLASCSSLPLPGVDATPPATPSPQPSATLVPPTPTITPTPTWLVPLTDLRGVTVRFWHPWLGETANTVEQLARDFSRANSWGIRVEVSAYGGAGALFDAVQAAAEEGSLPSVAAAQPDQIAVWQSRYGVLLDLNPYLNEPAWASSAAFYPAFWQEGQYGELRLSVPAERDARVLFYNQTWAQELGFPSAPATPAELRLQACAAFNALLADAAPENNGMGGLLVDLDSATILSWMMAFDAPQLLSASSGAPFNTPQTASALGYVRALLDDGCAWVSRQSSPYDYFAARQALFYAGSLSDLNEQVLAQARVNNRDTWVVIPFPSTGTDPQLVTDGLSYALFKSTPSEQLAGWAFMRWMMEPAQQARLALASGTLAPGPQAWQQMSNSAQFMLQKNIQELAGSAVPQPQDAAWYTVRHLLEDAAWQSIQPHVAPEQIPELLNQLDSMIPEVIN